jgi:hypothetical protein
VVPPKQEATFDYAFIPSDAFIGRPLGLVVELQYVDQVGLQGEPKNIFFAFFDEKFSKISYPL